MTSSPLRVALFGLQSIVRTELTVVSSKAWVGAYYDLDDLDWFLSRGQPMDALVIMADDELTAVANISNASSSRREAILIVANGQNGAFVRACLEAGADDVLIRAPSDELLSVKLGAILSRRADAETSDLSSIENLEFNSVSRLITLSDGRQTSLSPMEALYFRALVSAGSDITDDDALMHELNVSDVYLRNLTSRINVKLLELIGENLIERVRSRGYRLRRTIDQT